MHIADLRCDLLNVPIRYPLQDRDRDVPVLLLTMETEDGTRGYAASFYPFAEGIAAFLNGQAKKTLLGLDPRRTEHLRETLLLGTANRNIYGAWSCAASLVDIAAWDVKGKSLGEPVWRLLGGAREHVPTYVTFGIPAYDRDQLATVAQQLVADGHTRLKMVVGASANPDRELFGQPTDEDIKEDARRVAAVREAVGSDVDIMVDANKNPTYPQAVRLSRLIEDLDIAWFEDPLSMADPRLLAQFRRATEIPVAAGGLAVSDPSLLREYLVLEAVDFAQPNVRDIGGYGGALRAAGLAGAFHVPLSMGGNWPHLNLHLHAGVPNGGLVEFHLQGWKIVQTLFEGGVEPIGNTVRAPDMPGVGLELKADVAAELRVDA